jgi:hypothetical protein
MEFLAAFQCTASTPLVSMVSLLKLLSFMGRRSWSFYQIYNTTLVLYQE